MSYQYILFEVTQGAAVITLNRPEVLNSFTMPMAIELQKALTECRDDDKIRSILITGAGRAFCAGEDLAEAAPQDRPWPPIKKIVETSYNPTVKLIREIEKPILCAVNGIAAGAGANMALACDLVLASEKASFLQAFCHIGLVPDSGGTFFLPRLVGLPRATAMMMLGEKISAADAVDMGMIYKSSPPEKLMEDALALNNRLAQSATKGLGLTKRLLNSSFENDLNAQLAMEADLQKEAGESADGREGIIAFQQKRQAKFEGR